MNRWIWIATAPFALAACGEPQPAREGTAGTSVPARNAELEVTQPWVRDSAGRTANAAVFMTITSPVSDRLTGASSPVAEKTDLMTMKTEDEAMGMGYVEAIDLPAGRPVSLDPVGLHVWLEKLKRPLKAGDTFVLTLEFEKAGTREFPVSVIPAAATGPMAGM